MDAGQQAEQQARMNDQKNGMLGALLDQEARARLNTVRSVKPKKAEMVEGIIINMARQGQLQGKISEPMLRNLLEQVSAKTEQKTKIVFNTRRAMMDSDSDSD